MTWTAFLQAKLRRKLRDPLYCERARAWIVSDLFTMHLDTCQAVGHRQTAHLTRVLPDDTTLVDVDRTHISFFDATTTKVKVP
jgi:hypothetical protein